MGSSDFSCKEILYGLFPLLFQFSQSSLESSPIDICGKLYNNSFLCLLLNVKSNYPVPSQSILPLFRRDLKKSWPYHRMNYVLCTAYLLSVRKKGIICPFAQGLLAYIAQHKLSGNNFICTAPFWLQKRERERKGWGKIHLIYNYSLVQAQNAFKPLLSVPTASSLKTKGFLIINIYILLQYNFLC